MGAKLDKSRPYGTVYGDTSGVCFEQDHKEFDSAGNQIAKAIAGGAKVSENDPPPAPVLVVLTKDDKGNVMREGQILDLEGMERDELHVLASAMGLDLNPQLGAPKTRRAIIEGATLVDQMSQQLSQ